MERSLECKVLSVEEAGKVVGLGKSAAYKAIHNGELPSIKLGRKLVVPIAELERLLGERL